MGIAGFPQKYLENPWKIISFTTKQKNINKQKEKILKRENEFGLIRLLNKDGDDYRVEGGRNMLTNKHKYCEQSQNPKTIQ